MGGVAGSSPSRRILGIFKAGCGLLCSLGRERALGACDDWRHYLRVSTGMDSTFTLGFRITLPSVFVLTAALVLRRTSRFGFFVVLRLAPSALAGLAFRRGVFGLLRVTRRTVRAAGFAAFPSAVSLSSYLAATPSAGVGFSLMFATLRRQQGRRNVNLPLRLREAREEPGLTSIPNQRLTPRPLSLLADQHCQARSRSLVRARASFAILTSSAIS